jgi:hypothetical protein
MKIIPSWSVNELPLALVIKITPTANIKFPTSLSSSATTTLATITLPVNLSPSSLSKMKKNSSER